MLLILIHLTESNLQSSRRTDGKLRQYLASVEVAAHLTLFLVLIILFFDILGRELAPVTAVLGLLIVVVAYYGVWQYRRRPNSLKAVFLLMDCQAYTMIAAISWLIVDRGYASSLSWLYSEFFWVYVFIFIIALFGYPMIFKFKKHTAEKIKIFSSHFGEGSISDTETYYMLSHYGFLESWGKSRFVSIVAPIVLISIAVSLLGGRAYGYYCAFIVLLLSLPGLVASVAIRRWFQHKYFGSNDLLILESPIGDP